MAADKALYNVREQSGNPAHTSVEDVVERVFERARNPREDYQDAHFDGIMADVVDRYGTTVVRTVIHRVLVEQYPFRTATIGLDMRTVDGVRIGTTAIWSLQELNRKQDA
ncbi:hypothetical protein [Haladaptatus caseinilyticus]|uniref:hypothetical protein n=1 Tax=Haladaptatus caseinilyticus TaxID=2993314 RepID=UPI00224B82C6|nr:hypothetical protein [Haladaptatus caseinilyticus]